jgi:orotidine-5'-phosphate decarboxylase
MTTKLIVALDFNTQNDALKLVEQLDAKECSLKVGSEMFTLLGAPFVKQLVQRQFKVFLDLKFHDIPNTVARACSVAADMGVWMMNVHAMGGMDMMMAAKKALESHGKDAPILIAVTVLTSHKQEDLAGIGINKALADEVMDLAKLARDSGLDGVVSSAHEARVIKQVCGSGFVNVTPGIRLPSDAKDDQSRIMTPKEAIQAGSDYLVIGRPITRSASPYHVVSEILRDIS